MALTSLTKDFITRSGLSVEGTGIVTTATYTNGLNTGTFQVAGGAAISKNLIVGNTATIYGITYLNNQLVVNSSATIATTLTVSGGTYLNGMTSTGVVVASASIPATGQGTGALQVPNGGASVGGNLYVGGTTYLAGDLYVDGTQFVVNSSSVNAGENALVLSTGSTTALMATKAGIYIGASSSTAYTSFYYDGVSSWIVPNSASSGGLKVQGLVGTNSTNTGALQVAGGAGIGGGLFVGGVTTASNFVGYFGGPGSQAIGTGANLYGGSAAALVYQSAANTTAFLSAGSNGTVLQMIGGALTWSTLGSISAGQATTATNIAGGTVGQVPYQSAVGNTAFSAGLTYGAANQTLTATNITIPGVTNATSTSSGALQVAGGIGVGQDVYIGGSLYVGGEKLGGNTGTFIDVNITGTGVVLTVPNGSATFSQNVTATTLVVSSLNASTITNASNALYVAGGVGIDKSLTVNGTTVLNGNVTIFGTVTGTNVILNNITGTNAQFYGDATGNGALYAGVLGYTPFAQTMAQFTGNLNNYMEVNVQNINSGTQASTDIVASADNVTTSSAYIDMGITSSKWDGTQNYSLGTVLGPNDGYIMVGQNNQTANAPGDLVFGTLTTGTQMRFVVAAASVTSGLPNTSTVVMYVNQVQTPTTSTATGALVVTGGVGVSGGLFVGGTVTATNLVLTGNETVAGTLAVNSVVGTNGTNTGALTVVGGVGINGGLVVNGTITGTNVNFTGNETVGGSLVVTGNIQGAIVTATTLAVTGNETVSGSLVVTNNIQGAIVTATTLAVTGSAVVTGNIQGAIVTATTLNVTGNETVGGSLVVTGNITATVVTATSAVISGNLQVGSLTLNNPVSFANLTATNLTVAGGAVITNLNVSTSTVLNGVTTLTNVVYVTTATNGTNATSGQAMLVTGGVGVAGNIAVAGTVYAGTTGTTNQTVNDFVGNNFVEAGYSSNTILAAQAGVTQYLDAFSTSTYRSAEYMVQITDFPSIHVEKIMLFHDGTNNIYMTEFGVITNNGELGTFDAAFSGTNVVLKFTPTSPTAMNIKMQRTSIII